MAAVARRRGAIDEVDNLSTLDLASFNGGLNPFGNRSMEAGFKPGAAFFRRMVDRWGFTERGDVAEIRCGYGRWSLFLAEVNDAVTGYDDNPGAIELCRKLAKLCQLGNARFEVADPVRLPLADETLDGVWVYNALQFLDRASALREIRRVLEPDGLLFVGVYSGLARVFERFFEGYAEGGVAHHGAQFSLRALKNGPFFDGRGAYATAEDVAEVIARFGFQIAPEFGMEVEMARGVEPCDDYLEEMADLPALAVRLENDPRFAAEFVRHPLVAYRYPKAVHFCAVKS